MVYVENEQTAIEDLRSPSYDNEEVFVYLKIINNDYIRMKKEIFVL